MSNLTATQVPLPLKGWEAKARMGLKLLLGGIGLIVAYYGLPLLIEVLKNGVIAIGYLFTLGALGGALVATGVVVKHLMPFIGKQLRVFSYKIAEGMVRYDPVGWSKIYIADYREKHGLMLKAYAHANKSHKMATTKKRDYTEARDDAQTKARLALEKGDKALALRWSRAAERKKKSLERIERRIQILEFIVRALSRMSSALEIKIADEEDELNSFIDEYNDSANIDEGIRAGMSALAPSEDRRMIKEQAISAMLERSLRTQAELEMAMQVFEPIIATADLEDEAALERLNESFNRWEKEAEISLLGPGGKQLLLAETFDPNNLLQPKQSGEAVPVKRESKPLKSGLDGLIDR